ncbi:tRNA (adenosine(37)-N6)-dimethylallyltransferase MiaA [Paenibacillus sp. 1781tsa1]|uniref:tRNA (adenosine(37)-N6)-dimethylallyltransferase MiaA n=1 Tax=Paenibacillus sp. 1781tsa1 TaxID=2953810 RepID=UPI00209FF3C7|nr:tRNA (adenosine(37)-N6)-dimethylallyltransferase MiaA [Paenibacillus sp. 1781tsa1]MCP1185129.1 tRNA (adenosine(37)-N6)-dimethylallyltransferase MiaA [Paenibacillus sp. 1781tsa1]
MLNVEVKPKPKLLVLVGPTAVGKTRMSIELAQAFNCEIISGDSMQVYREMDIGTAKITSEEMKGVPHHLIDIHEPEYPYSVAEFQESCTRLISEIHERGKMPFIVGGTGLYVESVCYGFQFSDSGSDEAFREQQFSYAEQYGAQALHDRLREVDPVSADRLHPNDQRRIVRALEIHHLTGEKWSDQLAVQKKESPYDLLIVGLTMDRQKLYARVEERIDLMIEQGLVDEVKSLLERGVARGHISMQGLGYKEIAAYLQGEVSWEAAVEWLKRDTRRFAKRQLSWFRHMKDIEWVDMTDTQDFEGKYKQISKLITRKFD